MANRKGWLLCFKKLRRRVSIRNMFTTPSFQTENYFFIESEDDFIKCFRLRDQKKLVMPTHLKFPMKIRSYFTWQESSGVYTYLIYKNPSWDMPRGMALKKIHQNGEPVGGLCGWCNSYGSSEEIGTLSVAVNSKTTFAYLLCRDLRCVEKIEDACGLAGKSAEKYIDQLYKRMNLFFENIAHHQNNEG